MKFQKLILSTLIGISLAGCQFDENVNVKIEDTLTPEEPLIPEEPPSPPVKNEVLITLMAGNQIITGDVSCNNTAIDQNGQFKAEEEQNFSCEFGTVNLGNFQATASTTRNSIKQEVLYGLANINSQNNAENAIKVLKSINKCPTESSKLCLNALESIDIQEIYQNLDNDTLVNDFVTAQQEKPAEEIVNAPSSHTDTTIVPAITPGASNDLNSNFISSAAEKTLIYTPSPEAKVLTKARLTDANGLPIVGMSFFSANSTGFTDELGQFEYLWGDNVTFGVDTFTFGTVRGNQLNFKLTDVATNPITKSNIQSLLDRYATKNNASLSISDKFVDTFALYPNVINQLIDLTLSNGEVIAGTNFSTPNDFEAQFADGLAKEIDDILKNPTARTNYQFAKSAIDPNESSTLVTDSLNAILENVTSFHVFNDNMAWYGASGYTRGIRALNMSNSAFPVIMPRTDINRQLAFGERQALTREGKPYIAEHPTITMPPIPVVSKDNTTFGFPFVTTGMIGQGKILFMGNHMYASILSCPDTYWAGAHIGVDGSTKKCTLPNTINPATDTRFDNGSMKTFFANLFNWFTPDMQNGSVNVATNIKTAVAFKNNTSTGIPYDFFINEQFNFANVTMINQGDYSGLSVATTPILILQAFDTIVKNEYESKWIEADLTKPSFTQEDISALIQYVNDGGNIVFIDTLSSDVNPEPIGRLADAAGVSWGGANVTPTNQAFCKSSYYCQAYLPNIHSKTTGKIVVLERFPDMNGSPVYRVEADENGLGKIVWNPPATMSKFEVANVKYKLDGKDVTYYAHHVVTDEMTIDKAVAEIHKYFPGTPMCTNDYQYEFNCIEVRDGHGILTRGTYHRKDFDRYDISPDVISSMIKSANLGDNINALFEHELYYRTKGAQGIRLTATELNQKYDSLSIWLWNNNKYSYVDGVEDELGFKDVVEFLNCYSNDTYGNGASCPTDLKEILTLNNQFVFADNSSFAGELNPSYPLNYMEKPLTRIMLGRSFWDHGIKVHAAGYPGLSAGTGSSATATIETAGKKVHFSAGNNQPTGLWAPQLQDVTVSGDVDAVITVMMADNLTGLPQHETALNRPPRMQHSYNYTKGASLTINHPYGGLISIRPKTVLTGETTQASFSFSNVEKAAFWQNGAWIYSPEVATAPLAEIDTGSMIFTVPKKNVLAADLNKFSLDSNFFADALSDFYGRDETTQTGSHRRMTYSDLAGFRHRFVYDKQISIGAAHSGYPVMSTGFNETIDSIKMNPLDNWLLWHEVGHNTAAAPFKIPGATEVTNNLVGLYMQEKRVASPHMSRISIDIQKAPIWVNQNAGHAWSHTNANMRLAMFGQLKIWAEKHFNIDAWYKDETKPSIYDEDQGWNMFKLMHRKARGDTQGDSTINYCNASTSGLDSADQLMLCASYVSGYDLSHFFTQWNIGETSTTSISGEKSYQGGITSQGLSALSALKLPKPSVDPLTINSLPN